jgi:glutathione S-transferase
LQQLTAIFKANKMANTYKLYGIPCSLYTAKARSYLRKQKINFSEFAVSDAHYQKSVVPKIGRMIMPVLESSDGEIIQDSADIIRYFEEQHTAVNPALPDTPLLQAVSHLFELFGGEGLLRPAMHYRWNFDDVNLDFLRSEFECLAPQGTDHATYQQIFEFGSGRMRKAAKSFGVAAHSSSAVEASYLEFLTLLSAHLREFPYLLGGRATLGDYALMGPLFAHLYRDPKPGLLMRQHAPLVARWVERMNTAEDSWTDHPNQSQTLISGDVLPDTLIALMRYIAEEYLPEISAHISYTNNWLAERPELAPGTNGLDDPTQRFIGNIEFPWRGITLKTSVVPYRFYLLQDLHELYDGLENKDRKHIEGVFTECGLERILTSRLRRRLERRNYLEVWGDDIAPSIG